MGAKSWTVLVLLALAAALVCAVPLASLGGVDCEFREFYPKQYVAHKLGDGEKIVVDGHIDEGVWKRVPFTDDFVDIVTPIKPMFQTAAKVMWDDEYLYVAAYMQETRGWANITETCHCINPDQDQIIFHDNDFEIFVDPQGTTHYYKEFEINQLSATWDLCLNKPYINGGYENSTRVFANGFDMPTQRAASVVDGAINDPSKPTRHWTTEVALPLSSLAYNQSVPLPPTRGQFWRINFSRVEWHTTVVNNSYIKTPKCQSCSPVGAAVEDNWVWQEMGAVNMHLPQRWGMLVFDDASVSSNNKNEQETNDWFNPEWPARFVAAAVYDAQTAYAAANGGKFTDKIEDLVPYASHANVIDGTCTSVPHITLDTATNGYVARVDAHKQGKSATIRDDRFLVVESLY